MAMQAQLDMEAAIMVLSNLAGIVHRRRQRSDVIPSLCGYAHNFVFAC